MAQIAPFAALRPTPDTVGRVAAVPYDVVDSAEAAALAEGEPLSFLRVSRPEIECPPGTAIYSDAVYAKAASNFDRLRRTAPLVVESAPRFYVYRLHMGGHVQTGVAAGFSVDEYARDLIKKHEKTRPDKEDDRTRHILALRAQTGPVFLTYRASPEVDAVVAARRGPAAALRLHRRRRRAARGLGGARGRRPGARPGLRGDPRALHRRWPPSRGQRLPHAPGAEG